MPDFYLKKLKTIKAFVFDFDGVFTDGQVYVSDNGEFMRSTNIKDGYAVNRAVLAGYPIVVISGGSSEGVVKRLQRLGVKDVFIQVKNKSHILDQWLEQNGLNVTDCLVMGDDLPDKEVLQKAGFSCCPADASAEIRQFVDFVSPISGGKGCVRNIIETKMKLDNTWDSES